MPFHYGWVILASGALGAFMTTPGQTIGVSSFFDPVARDLALSRADVARVQGRQLQEAIEKAGFTAIEA